MQNGDDDEDEDPPAPIQPALSLTFHTSDDNNNNQSTNDDNGNKKTNKEEVAAKTLQDIAAKSPTEPEKDSKKDGQED